MVKKADEVLKDLLFMAMCIFVISFVAFAQEEIPYSEPRPAVSKIKIDSIRILRYTKTCEITLRYLDENGDIVREETLIYQDVADNPETLDINEACTDYSDLMQGLGINKQFLKNQIKGKLGIE